MPTCNQQSNRNVARIVVEDTIRSAHTDPKLDGDATVQNCFEALKGPQGEELTQSVCAEYLGHEGAAAHLGIIPEFDARAIDNSVNITAAGLRQEAIKQLDLYLKMSEKGRQIFRETRKLEPAAE